MYGRNGQDGTVPYQAATEAFRESADTVRFPQRDDSAQFTVAQAPPAVLPPPAPLPPPTALPPPAALPQRRPPDPRPPDPTTQKVAPPIRIGSGVSAAVSARTGERRRASRVWWGRFTRFVSGVATLILVVAAVWTIWQWWQKSHNYVKVADVTVAPAQLQGGQCDVQYDVVGTITTNGKPGTIIYEWLRSDGTTSGQLKQSVADGETTTHVHLYWRFSGQGSTTATAILQVLDPARIDGSAQFPYSCK